MLSEPPKRLRTLRSIPDDQLVVVPSARELVLADVPFETADFLTMGGEFPEVVLGSSNVSVVDVTISRTGGEDVVVPGETTDATCVTGHGSDLLAAFGVPDLDFSLVGSDGDCVALKERREGTSEAISDELSKEGKRKEGKEGNSPSLSSSNSSPSLPLHSYPLPAPSSRTTSSPYSYSQTRDTHTQPTPLQGRLSSSSRRG